MRAAQSPTLTAPAAEPPLRRPPLLFGPFAFDPQSRLLSREGREVPLPPRVLGVLELLLQRAGDVVGRQELIDTIWKDAFVTDTSLAEAVSVLRQTLGDDSQSPTYIQTLHRRGYRFVAPVTSPAGAAAAIAETAEPEIEARVSPSIGRELVPWSAAAIFACIAAVAIWQLARAKDEPRVTTRFSVAPAAGTAFDSEAPALALSPDGTRLAWSACDSDRCPIFVRTLDRIDASPLPGVLGHAPFFSPDGRWLGYFSDGRLMKVALSGGTPITIADAPTALGGVWIDREIIFAGASSGGLHRVAAEGGEVRTLTRPNEAAGEIRHVWPAHVPGTRVVVFTIDTNLRDAGTGSPGTLAALSLDTVDNQGQARRWRTLMAGASIARAAAADALVFARDGDLNAVGFDAARLGIAGTPRAIAGNLATARGRAQYALSPSGALVMAQDVGGGDQQAVTLERNGVVGPALPYRDAALSPDGTRIAGVRIEETRSDIWIADVERGGATRLTHTAANTSPVWSADRRSIYFASRVNGPFEIWRRDADGTSAAVRVHQAGGRHVFPLTASPDGALLAFLQTDERTRADIWVLPLAGGTPRPLVQGPFDEGAAQFSPDSSMIAFESAESGRWEIYVSRVRDGKRTLVSTSGGRHPIWTPAGLHYQVGRTIVRATVADDDGELRVRGAGEAGGIDGDLIAIAADGRVLTNRAATRTATATVALDWMRELRALLGPLVSEPPR